MRNVKKQSHLLYKKKQEKVLYTTSLAHSETVKMSLSQKLTRGIKNTDIEIKHTKPL